MLGAIAGDVIGSVYEFSPIKTKDFELFSPGCGITDDSILTIAIADAILHDDDYQTKIQSYARRYPNPTGSYGARFSKWIWSDDPQPYGSWGNGSAMRVSAVGYAFDDLDTVLHEAKRTAVVTHDHPEGIKGAQATAAAVFLSRTGQSKAEIKAYIEQTFGYDLSRSLDEIRPIYEFNESCQGTVPEAMTAFLASTDFEDAIRNAVSLGGDCDTLTCITGGMAQAFYGGVPDAIATQVLGYLDDDLKKITVRFMGRFCS